MEMLFYKTKLALNHGGIAISVNITGLVAFYAFFWEIYERLSVLVLDPPTQWGTKYQSCPGSVDYVSTPTGTYKKPFVAIIDGITMGGVSLLVIFLVLMDVCVGPFAGSYTVWGLGVPP